MIYLYIYTLNFLLHIHSLVQMTYARISRCSHIFFCVFCWMGFSLFFFSLLCWSYNQVYNKLYLLIYLCKTNFKACVYASYLFITGSQPGQRPPLKQRQDTYTNYNVIDVECRNVKRCRNIKGDILYMQKKKIKLHLKKFYQLRIKTLSLQEILT